MLPVIWKIATHHYTSQVTRNLCFTPRPLYLTPTPPPGKQMLHWPSEDQKTTASYLPKVYTVGIIVLKPGLPKHG